MGSLVAMHGLSSCGMSCLVAVAPAELLHGMWDLGSSVRVQTCILCLARQSLNHWTTREVPIIVILLKEITKTPL